MGKREVVKKNRSKQKRQDFWVILTISLIALAIVGVIVVSKLPKGVATITSSEKPNANGLNMGNPNASVKVIEFADFQCPYCQLYWQDVEPTIIKDYIATNKIYYTYSPMAFIGQESIDAEEAAYCANDQNAFWQYRDYLLNNHTAENAGDFTQDKLIEFARKLNLDVNTFKSCLTSGKYVKQVNDNNTYAQQQGVNSTPTIMVNGKAYSSSDALSAIQSALAGK